MAPLRSQRNLSVVRQPVNSRRQAQHLVRCTHIFASAVRELLEARLLAEVTRAPLSLSQFHLLKAVALNGSYASGELAGFMGVSAAAGTKNFDKLERLGFILRVPSATDRRVTLLSASAKGRRLVERYEARKAQSLTPVLDRFTPEELSLLASLLERFALTLISRQGTAPGLCLFCAAYCIKGCPVGKMRGGCPFERLGSGHGTPSRSRRGESELS